MVFTRNRKTKEHLPFAKDRIVLMQELEYRTDELGDYYEEEYQILVLDEQEMSKDAFDNMIVCEDVLKTYNYGRNESNRKCKAK